MRTVHWTPWRICLAAAVLLPATAEAEIRATVTIKPVHALVAQVLEGVGQADLLVTGSASPHSYALKPSDVRNLGAAQAFFRVSAAVEPFTEKIIASLPSTVRSVTLAEAPGVAVLAQRSGGTFEPHEHEAHDHAPGETDTAGGAADGHVWLDPRNAKAMVREIARVLSEISPADAGKLHANADAASQRLDRLEQDIAAALAPVRGRPFIVFHDAYQYFERRFGVDAVGALTALPEAHPSAKRLSGLRQHMTRLNAVCAFGEPNAAQSLIAVATEGTGIRLATLDPEGLAVEAGPEAYETLLRNLAQSMRACLEPR